jgi:hypothetical protein
MSKIGEDTKAKQQEKEPYYTLGIAKLDEGGYAVISLKVHGTEVLVRKVVHKLAKLEEALQVFLIESGGYQMKYVNKEIQ